MSSQQECDDEDGDDEHHEADGIGGHVGPLVEARTRAPERSVGDEGDRRGEQRIAQAALHTPAISASCVSAEAMVVSEIGETLSPNVAPPMIAPARIVGAAPSGPPAG